MGQKLESRLGVMMFLEYVIWGSWLPLLSLYLSEFLHFRGIDIGWIFGTLAIASVTAVFVSGQIADRYFASERFLALSHPVGGSPCSPWPSRRASGPSSSSMLVHQLVYVPTLSLTNSICFHHLKDAQSSSAGCGCGARSAGSRRAGPSSSSFRARQAPAWRRR